MRTSLEGSYSITEIHEKVQEHNSVGSQHSCKVSVKGRLKPARKSGPGCQELELSLRG